MRAGTSRLGGVQNLCPDGQRWSIFQRKCVPTSPGGFLSTLFGGARLPEQGPLNQPLDVPPQTPVTTPEDQDAPTLPAEDPFSDIPAGQDPYAGTFGSTPTATPRPLLSSSYPACDQKYRDAEALNYCERWEREQQTPAPSDDPAPTPSCSVDYATATEAMEQLASQYRDCEIDSGNPLPALIEAPGENCTTVGSRSAYLSARADAEAAKDMAPFNCAAPVDDNGGSTGGGGQPGGGYIEVEAGTTAGEQEVFDVTTETVDPGMGRGKKAAIGVGGLLVVGGVVWMFMRKRKKRRKR